MLLTHAWGILAVAGTRSADVAAAATACAKVCTHILARERHLQHYAEEQKAKRWRGNDPHAPLLE